VANSGVITALNGGATQYVRGDGTLADFPTSTGGGSSVSYYLNSSVSQGTIGGVAYRQLSKTPISGAGTDITASTNGYIASYLTDANDPSLLEVPAGNFNCEFYFSVNSNAHNPYVYAELYKYDGTTFTLLGSNVAIPEYLTNGTTLSAYYFAIPVAVAALTVTDRLAIRIYVNVDTRTVTLHTENSHLCQVVTTFSKGLISLNNLTRQNQFFGTGTSGTDFGIVSSVATHTFNLPIASATNTGKLSSTDWSTFNNKQATLSFTAPLVNTSNTISIPVATSIVDGYLDNLDWVNFNTAYNRSLTSAAVTGTTTKTLTLNKQDGGTITASWTDDNTDAVTSVFGRTGAVVATSGDYTTTQVTEGTNLYFTDTRARGALSFVAGSGAYNSTTGVITIPTNNNQITNGAGYITSSALSAYLPLAGGTLTGALNGTSAVFSSTATATAFIPSGSAIPTNGMYLSAANTLNFATNTANRFTIASDGIATFGTDLYVNRNIYVNQSDSGVYADLYGRNSTGTSVPLAFLYGSAGSVTWNNGGVKMTLTSAGALQLVSSLTASSIIKSGGTSSQFLKADGSVDSNTYLTTSAASSTYLPLSGGTVSNTTSAGTPNVLIIKNNTNTDNGYAYSTLALDTTLANTAADIRLGSATPLGIRIYASTDVLTSSPTGAGFQLFTNSHPSFSGQVYFDSGAHNSAALIFRTAQTSGTITERFRISASGTSTFAGVLYGTSAGFSGTLSVTGAIIGTSATFSGGINAINFTASTTITNTASSGYTAIYANGGGVYLGGAASTNHLSILSTGAATFSSSVTAMGSNIQLNIDGTYGSGYYSLGFGGITNGFNRVLAGNGTNDGLYLCSSTGNKISFRANGGATDNMVITSGGNVGIGTSSPQGILHLAATTANTYFYNTFSNAANRNWALAFGIGNLGDFNIMSSNAEGGNPVSSGTSRFNIQTNGNVGIGTSSPSQKLSIGTITGGGTGTGTPTCITLDDTFGNGTVGTNFKLKIFQDNATNRYGLGISDNLFEIVAGTNGGIAFFTNGATERMRITSGGALCIGGTSYGGLGISFNQNVGQIFNYSGTGVNTNIEFKNSNGTVGYIQSNGTTTAYVVTSDYRLKEDFKILNGLEKVLAIKTYDYKWKNSDDRMDGVIAHELAEVLPYAVYGEKNGKDMQGVDYSKLVPILIKSIQELEARIKQLENK
jgi:hypothetical protein